MLAEDLIPTDDPLVMRDKGRHHHPYVQRVCAYAPCGLTAWMLKNRDSRYCSISCSVLGQKRDRCGQHNSHWVGDAAGYDAQHARVRRARGKADRCIHRNAIHCTSMIFDWAWIHGQDRNDIYSYVPMCHLCHMQYDQAGVPKPGNQGGKNGRAKQAALARTNMTGA
jgi:hypothetical protein